MSLASRKTIELLCRKYGLWPRRNAGQNFLISEVTLRDIVSAAGLSPQDTVLEIGAGFGTLTAELADRAGAVIAVELDRRLIAGLKKMLAARKNLTIIEGDILKQWPVISSRLSDGQYKLVANLPYNITSWVLRNFLENKPRPSEMIILVQKEVAERVIAGPGEMSLLSIAVQFYGVPEIVRFVPRSDFWPAPEIDSAVLHVYDIGHDARGHQKHLGQVSVKKFFSLVKIGFSAKRKQLHNNLSAGLRVDASKAKKILTQSKIDPSIRAQDLAIEDWIRIAHTVQRELK